MDVAAAIPAPAPHPVFRLAESADRAEFGPAEPGRVPGAEAWALLRRLRRVARRAAPWYRRMFWWADPRPLMRR